MGLKMHALLATLVRKWLRGSSFFSGSVWERSRTQKEEKLLFFGRRYPSFLPRKKSEISVMQTFGEAAARHPSFLFYAGGLRSKRKTKKSFFLLETRDGTQNFKDHNNQEFVVSFYFFPGIFFAFSVIVGPWL